MVPALSTMSTLAITVMNRRKKAYKALPNASAPVTAAADAADTPACKATGRTISADRPHRRRVSVDQDFGVHPQRALGTVLIEVMHAGNRIVATPVGGIPGLIEGGVTGLLVPPGRPEARA
ncbi:glycosyltransferase [Microbispora sp. KK1-11]|uniref:glycosyltransferase n=1 Tax=Microbispora sp. KK1-11 TaxID=2053005 RepID=UPI001158F10D|nr:glycosyltransferase [Microbispora sp. KK1-11]TQS30422.1 glycosyltransferase family 4 protein [Microbispora sp. KK1-11]